MIPELASESGAERIRFNRIASGSLHGWPWIVFALFGTWAGLELRPAIGLSDPPASKR